MVNGPAPGYIHRNPETNVLQILRDVATGMRYLAAQTPPIAHGDLKGANVLIDSNGRACICDFGLSRLVEGFKPTNVSCFGTVRWMAPEQLIADDMTVSLAADIFSWGMLALEVRHKLVAIVTG
ncbi:tyrosine kinase catalytic domain protein, partial [Rhizoctonia solani AG-3 Rhs1AP]